MCVCVTTTPSPLLHAFLQGRQQELLVEAVDGADVGEDAGDHVAGEGGAGTGLLQETPTEHLVQEVQLGHVGPLRLQQLVGYVEHSLLDRQLEEEGREADVNTNTDIGGNSVDTHTRKTRTLGKWVIVMTFLNILSNASD